MKHIINIINKHFKPLKLLNDKIDISFINDFKQVIKQYNVSNNLQAVKILEFLKNNFLYELSTPMLECLENIKKDLQN